MEKIDLNVLIKKYLAGEFSDEELEKAEKIINSSPALKAIVISEQRKAAGIEEPPLPGLDPYILLRYVSDVATTEDIQAIESAIESEKEESGTSQTEQEIEMIRELIREGYLSYEGMQNDFLKHGAQQ